MRGVEKYFLISLRVEKTPRQRPLGSGVIGFEDIRKDMCDTLVFR